MHARTSALLAVAALASVCGLFLFEVLGGHSESPTQAAKPLVQSAFANSTTSSANFVPPSESSLGDDDFAHTVKLGKKIFTQTDRYAKAYVGNRLHCDSCHLDAGRMAEAAPMWGAYVLYPEYRSKTQKVNTFAERLQDCFIYSMNGKAPPIDDPVIVALETYSRWLATGARVGVRLEGQGFPKPPVPAQAPSYQRGAVLYGEKCVVCHGAQGEGQSQQDGTMTIPALWGSGSFNWGAGMHQLTNAASFILANMPLGQGRSLSNQDAWDLAIYVDSHERPQDPRYAGSVVNTRLLYHDSTDSMYGQIVNGRLLGSE